MIPRLIGPGLSKAGKFPFILAANETLTNKREEAYSSLRIQQKKSNSIGSAVGDVKMDDANLLLNIQSSIAFHAHIIPKGWQNIKAIYLKSTMGKVQRLF